MIYGTYLSGTGIVQAQAKQDVIANNLANSETVGFRRLLTLQQERAVQPDAPDHLREATGGNILLPTRVDTTSGALEQTGRPLDAALIGDGFFTVQKAGQTFLTRDGRFSTDDQGRLTMTVNPEALVLGRDNQPITLPVGTGENDVAIDEQGGLRLADGTKVADLLVSVTDGPIRPTGTGLLTTDAAIRAADHVDVRSQFVETSNVDPTVELTRLIRIARDLEAHANLIRHQDSALGRLIEASAIS